MWIKNFRRNFLLLSIGLFVLLWTAQGYGKDVEDTIVYKLALIHARNVDPEEALTSKKFEPGDAIVAEFKWIMGSLLNRCLNPKEAIANTIIEAW